MTYSITDDELGSALTYLAESAKPYADAKALRVVAEEKLRIVRSDLTMRALEDGHKTVSEREAFAYSHAEYRQAVKDLGECVGREELLKCYRVAAEAKIEAWRTLSASRRAANIT